MLLHFWVKACSNVGINKEVRLEAVMGYVNMLLILPTGTHDDANAANGLVSRTRTPPLYW